MLERYERDFFYTAEPKEKEVTKEEFEDFLSQYLRNLVVNICGISTPDLISYNDFELANRWPYSVVAHTWDYDDDPYYAENPEEKSYYIVENCEELFASKTGNKA